MEEGSLGVVLSYVTSFLRGRGPGVSQPSPLGRGWGRGRWLSSLSPLPVLQTLADLCGRHCFPSAPAPRRLHPPRGWVPKRAVVVRVCETSGLLASVTENQALGSSLAPQGKDEGREAWSSTMPTRALASCPTFSPLPPRESAMGEGPKGRGPRLPQHHRAPPCLALGNLTSLSCHHMSFSSGPKQPPPPHTSLCAQSRAGQRRQGCRRDGVRDRKAEIHSRS